MDYFANIVRRTGKIGIGIGGGLLVAIMALIVSNVIYRFFGGVITGSYELTQYMIVVVVGFAMVYTALMKGHVLVRVVVSRLPQWALAIAESFNSILSMGVVWLLAWATTLYLLKRGFVGEANTDLLELPYFPLKCVWVFTLILFSLVYLVDLYNALSRLVRK
jgi:TRAP-type C4-dicarboxylate transport system permease small subunit